MRPLDTKQHESGRVDGVQGRVQVDGEVRHAGAEHGVTEAKNSVKEELRDQPGSAQRGDRRCLPLRR